MVRDYLHSNFYARVLRSDPLNADPAKASQVEGLPGGTYRAKSIRPIHVVLRRTMVLGGDQFGFRVSRISFGQWVTGNLCLSSRDLLKSSSCCRAVFRMDI
jgi:hypothetical protein